MICCACKLDKPDNEFAPRDGGRRRHTKCRTCQKIYRQEWWSKNSPKYANRYANNLEHHRAECRRRYHQSDKKKAGTKTWKAKILREFGLTVDDYNLLLEQQNGVCAICKKVDSDGRRLAVDHCHGTGTVRGLLCRRCNTAIGLFEDDADLIQTAINYLNPSRQNGERLTSCLD